MSGKKHILVVEDEQHLAIGIKYNLEAEGYRVSVAGDGPEALRIFEANPDNIDLVILDLMLPGMSGYAVCERIRASHRSVPIMILSARTLSEDRTRGFDVGADQYMMKPFDLDELLSRVKGLLAAYARRSEADAAHTPKLTRYAVGDAEIDFEKFEVAAGGQTVRMTQLEMRLLEYFIDNEGRVIPRGELLENVWELPATIQTRAPDQFIHRLRKVFEKDPAKPAHFLTIRDVGYRFVAAGE
ncbi:MAG: response regulator transcription factor [Planctomycetales bacterium]|nr:response regulator transcription factor [Planctomycetales bacterium]